jgi:hypothetical protein
VSGNESLFETAMLLGAGSLALEFCHREEIYPEFVKFLERKESFDAPPRPILSREQLEVFDIAITGWSDSLFKKAGAYDEQQAEQSSGSANGSS